MPARPPSANVSVTLHAAPAADAHHTRDGFRNPHMAPSNNSLWSFLKLRWFGDEPWADQTRDLHRLPQVKVDAAALRLAVDRPTLTWLGHASFLIRVGHTRILTDPVFSPRVSPLSFIGPHRLTPPPVALADLPPIDLVVISHNHYDHLDETTLRQLGNQPHYLVPLQVAPHLTALGIDAARIHSFDWWQQARITVDGQQLTATATPAQHWSSRGLWDRNRSLWCGWHLAWDNFVLWFAGDTGYNDRQFVEIGRRLAPPDVALLPIGAYAPRSFMHSHHINPAEAVLIHQQAGAKTSIGMHWGTYPLSAEALLQPVEDLAAARQGAGLDADAFITLPVGGQWQPPQG